jgi:hypothetical protein
MEWVGVQFLFPKSVCEFSKKNKHNKGFSTHFSFIIYHCDCDNLASYHLLNQKIVKTNYDILSFCTFAIIVHLACVQLLQAWLLKFYTPI